MRSVCGADAGGLAINSQSLFVEYRGAPLIRLDSVQEYLTYKSFLSTWVLPLIRLY